MAEVESHFPAVPVHATSALRSEGLAAIRATIRDGLTAAFVGSSGAGKSTLINTFLGEERMPTRGFEHAMAAAVMSRPTASSSC